MALFTDGSISSIEDLRGHDTQLLDVASLEGIDVTKKLALAQEEIGIEVAAMLAALYPVGSFGSLGLPAARIGNVVVTTPLKLWHVYRTLEMVYRDAVHSQLNERYAGRRDEYREMARWARERVIESGLGMTGDPIPQAPVPAVQAATGGLADGTYYVSTSWAGARNEEGASSLPAKITVAGSSFSVSRGAAPGNAVGWNVYVGTNPQALFLQNSAVIALSSGWVQPDTLAASKLAGTGQAAEWMQATPRVLQRG